MPRVLAKHWPGTPIHGDIRTLNAKDYVGTIDLVSGGFPCQPYSLAGKRSGDEDHRALWPEMLRIVEEVRHAPSLSDHVGGALNPEWVEWLMGFPVGWTDLEHLGTP